MQKTWLDYIKEVLNESADPLTPKEIWDKMELKGAKTNGKTPEASVGAQLYIRIRDDKDCIFIQASKRPAKFGIKGKHKELLEEVIEKEESSYNEEDLYPLFSAWLYQNNEITEEANPIFSTRINEKLTKKGEKGTNEWLNPDIVGVKFLFLQETGHKLREDITNFLDSKVVSLVEIYSFEVKKELNYHNLRESFFQAVSNSSWANYGYLVAEKISDDQEFKKELERLSITYGIGVVKLNKGVNSDNFVGFGENLFEARFNPTVDYRFLVKYGNKDFIRFLEQIGSAIKTKNINPKDWDYSDEISIIKKDRKLNELTINSLLKKLIP